MVRLNERERSCAVCHGVVPPGAGSLWWEAGPDDGGDVVGRTEAGWRIAHLEKAACQAVLAERATEAMRGRAEAAIVAEEKADRFGAELAVIRDGLEREVAQRGLVAVPEGCPILGLRGAVVLYEKSAFPSGGGASTEQCGRVVEVREGAYYASFGSVESSARWASASLIAEGQSSQRVCSWWQPGLYGPGAYPGPGVPETELTEAERARVAELRAAALADKRQEALRSLQICVDGSEPLKKMLAAAPGASVQIELPPDFDAYVEARASRVGNATTQVTLRVTLPVDSYARGKLKTAIAKRVPEGLVHLHNFASGRVVIASGG